MKITILGSTGMLGNAVGKYFINKYGEDDIFLTYRNKDVSYGKNTYFFDPLVRSLDSIPYMDYVINCIGKIKPFMMKNPQDSIYINSIFPRKLADECKLRGSKLIHITTDCVFSGKTGNYNENSLHDATDEYGKSKSLGEPSNCMVIRTSIIGEEIHKNASLISWAKSQKGKEINGFTNHLWNGITTNQYAKVCDTIINNNLYQESLFHVHSNIVTKYELMTYLNEKFNLSLTIKAVDAPEAIDRTMSTIKDLNAKLNIPTIKQQISEL